MTLPGHSYRPRRPISFYVKRDLRNYRRLWTVSSGDILKAER
jgi:hypothetical protein